MSAAESIPAPQTPLDWALHYMRLGWSVVPVRPPEKLPAVTWARFQTQPADEVTIRGWFDAIPGCGIGLVQGSRVGTFALDFDGEEGAARRAEFEARGLPIAPTSLTGSGGAHVLVRHPGRHVPTRKKVMPGLDVRGDGGFIVAPPSLHGVLPEGGAAYVATGRVYAWDVDAHPDDVAIPDCPEWLADIVCGPASGLPATGDVVRMPTGAGPLGMPAERVTDGRETYMRDTILAVARDLRDKLQRLPTEAELFEAAWPQYAAKVDFSRPGRGEAEFRVKVRYTLGRISAGQVRGVTGTPGTPTTFIDGSAEPTDGQHDAVAAPVAPLPLVYFADVKPNLDAADFVEGLLIETAMSVVYGPSNCGKTFFMTDLALHVATGRAWRGKEIEPGGVIYCALEGSHGISNRIAAFKQEHGLEGVEVPFAIVPVAINLLDPAADRAKLVETVRIAAEAMGVPVKLIVVDTLSRALAGGNENGPDDMGALVASADFIRQAAKAHICFIHHSGKDQAQGARGHSLLRAATDTEIEISRQDKDSPSTAKVTKQRELEIEGEFVFRLKAVELGKNRRGKAVTSCVVEPAAAADIPPQQARLSSNAKAARLALVEASAKHGRAPTGRDFPEGIQTVSTELWRREFYARSPLENQESKQKAFVRGSRELLDAKHVCVLHDQAWTVSDDQ